MEEEGDHGGSGSPDRPYHLVRSTHHMSKQRDTEKEEWNYYVGGEEETMIRLAEHAAANNNLNVFRSILVCDACCKCNEPTGSIVFGTERNRCRLFCHAIDAYAPFALADTAGHGIYAPIGNLSSVSMKKRSVIVSCSY